MKFLRLLYSPIKLVRRRWNLILPAALLTLIALPVVCDHHVASASVGKCHDELSNLKTRPVALLLGTAREIHGRRNVFYTRRIEAAAALYKAGKVRGILASGDNGRREYDEPTDMKTDLIAAGVPAGFITLDYAGFRTRDSVIRAKEVFGQDSLIIVSQRFHAERALFIARAEGISAEAFVAADPISGPANRKVRLREMFARSLAVADIILARPPKFLGASETVELCSSGATVSE